MGTISAVGATNKVIKYTDNGVIDRIVIAHIVSYSDRGRGQLLIETTTGGLRMQLASQNAVDAAIALLDSKF